MDEVIKCYKDTFDMIRARPSILLWMLGFFLFHYSLCLFYHWSCCGIEFPEVWGTALKSTIGLWLIIALFPAVLGAGG